MVEQRTSPVISVPVVLDRPRHIRLTNRALMRAEMRLSELYKDRVNINEILAKVLLAARPGGMVVLPSTTLVVLLHQSLIHEDPALTEDQVAEMTDFMSQPELVPALASALVRQMPPSTTTLSNNGQPDAAAGGSAGVVPTHGSTG